MIGQAQLQSVQTAGPPLCSFTTQDGQVFAAQQFIDASQSGELAAASGVAMMQGFDAVGLPNSTLSLGLVLDVYGLTIDQLKQIEATLIQRFLNSQDRQAQQWLAIASGNNSAKPNFNYGILHTLPQERQNLAVLGPASGFGGLGTTAGRIVEFNVGVGEGVAIAVAKALAENRLLHSITNVEVRNELGYTPAVYGHSTQSFSAIYRLEGTLRAIDYQQTHLDRGIAFFRQGNYIEAARQLSRAITLEANQAAAYYHRGNALVYLEYMDLALSDYTAALRLDPTLVQAYRNRGFVHLYYRRNYNQALADFEQALKLDPNYAEAQFGKGLALALRTEPSKARSLDQALLFLNQAIQMQPQLAIACMLRGLIQAERGDRPAALAEAPQTP